MKSRANGSGIDLREEKALTEKRILEIYKISHVTLWRWVCDGCPRHEVWKGKKRLWRYYQVEIDRFLESQRDTQRQAMAGRVKKGTKVQRHGKYFVNYPLPTDSEEEK